MPRVNGHPATRNKLLASMSAESLQTVMDAAELIPLEAGVVLFDANKPIEHVYFVERGVASVLGIMRDGTSIETATIGNEGIVGLSVFHGVDRTPAQSFCQVPGEAYRLPVETFRKILNSDDSELRSALGRYTEALFTLVAQASACNRMHPVRQRCARWLLLTHDRVGSDKFQLTQKFLAQMLGIRRASVNEVMRAFLDAGIVEYRMGEVTVIERKQLEAEACECYAIVVHEFDRLLDNRTSPSPLDRTETSRNGETLLEPPSVNPNTDMD